MKEISAKRHTNEFAESKQGETDVDREGKGEMRKRGNGQKEQRRSGRLAHATVEG